METKPDETGGVDSNLAGIFNTESEGVDSNLPGIFKTESEGMDSNLPGIFLIKPEEVESDLSEVHTELGGVQESTGTVHIECGGVDIRQVNSSEIIQAKSMVDAENWNDGVDYIKECYDSFPEGFLGAFRKPHDTLISFCFGIPLSEDVAIIMYYLTKAGYRGQGIGGRLLQETLTKLSKYNICLNCVYEKTNMYQKYGFCKEFNIFIYDNVPAANISLPAPSKSVFYVESNKEETNSEICKILCKGHRHIQWEGLLAFDAKISSVPREDYVMSWLKNPEVFYCVAYPIKGRKSAGPIGYAAIRPANQGHRIGPLYADSCSVAEELLKVLLQKVPGDTLLQFFAPQPNRQVREMVKRVLKVEPTEVYVRMHNKGKININFEKSFFLFNLNQVVI